jgi:hypothetical protein
VSSNAFTRPEKKKKAKIPEEEAEEHSGTSGLIPSGGSIP